MSSSEQDVTVEDGRAGQAGNGQGTGGGGGLFSRLSQTWSRLKYGDTMSVQDEAAADLERSSGEPTEADHRPGAALNQPRGPNTVGLRRTYSWDEDESDS